MNLIFAAKEPFCDEFVSVIFDYNQDTTDAKVIVKSKSFETVIDSLVEDKPSSLDDYYTIYEGDWKLFGINSKNKLIEFDCDFDIKLISTWKVTLDEELDS